MSYNLYTLLTFFTWMAYSLLDGMFFLSFDLLSWAGCGAGRHRCIVGAGWMRAGPASTHQGTSWMRLGRIDAWEAGWMQLSCIDAWDVVGSPSSAVQLDSASLHLARGLSPYERSHKQLCLCASTTPICLWLLSHCSLHSRTLYHPPFIFAIFASFENGAKLN